MQALRCDGCEQLPETARLRATLASIAAVLPIELAVHLVVVQTDLAMLAKVVTLAVTATVLSRAEWRGIRSSSAPP